MKNVLIPHLGHTVRLVPRDSLRRRKPCRTLTIPRHLPTVRAALPAPPSSCDWTQGNKLFFPMLGNDTKGDCMYTAACHGSQTMTGNVGPEDAFDTSAVVAAYLKLSGGDNGLDMDMMVGEWKRGLVGGPHRILADMSIDPRDQEAMHLAIWRFSGVLFTFAFLKPWLDATRSGIVWDAIVGVAPDETLGHGVWMNAYTQVDYVPQTWELNPPPRMTLAGVSACDPAADAFFSLDMFNARGLDANGYTYEEDAALWVALGGDRLPPSPFGTGPVAPPNPVLFSLRYPSGLPKGGEVRFASPVAFAPGRLYDVAARAAATALAPDVLDTEAEVLLS